MVKIRRSTRLMAIRCAQAALMVALLACGGAASTRGAMSQNNEISDMTIYYLSPHVLTRINMTPETLKCEDFRHSDIGSLAIEIMKLFDATQSANREIKKGKVFPYDFRLCVLSASDEACFSAYGKAAYVDEGLLLLSADEQRDVLALFVKLDALLDAKEKASKP